MRRKWLTISVLIATLLVGACAGYARTAPALTVPQLETTATSAVLMEAHSGQILYAKNPEQRLPMASVTKLMTLLLALEAVENGQVKLDDQVVASEHACSLGGSQIYLEPGEKFTFQEMLIAIAVGSANDASVAVAEHIAGSEEAFVQMMNERAARLGLKNTHFSNPTGLPAPDHYTSAADLATILRQCLEHELFIKISSIYEYDLRGGEFKLWNTNKLLKWYRGVDAGKTGWTTEARYCLASSCLRNNLRLIAVVLGCPEPKSHFRESIKLFNYGYAAYKALPLLAAGQTVKEIPVQRGARDSVGVISFKSITLVLPKADKESAYRKEWRLPAYVTAPVRKGQKVGELVITRESKEVARYPLLAAYDVPSASLPDIFRKACRKMLGQ
ncbi:MAG: D-alanyl-D-alanine carboxypeptidase family protein [Desulfurispora sp.]|uniref:D-alanyl-D-alanine carboxypeptidase family protein n=1 Tax=Desulfurispora sp. TaxID=3014275 RepID=UPI004049422A